MKINTFEKVKITKDMLRTFFQDNFAKNISDFTLRDIYNMLGLTPDDLPFLELYLEELEEEELFVKNFCEQCGVYEYDKDWGEDPQV